MMPEPGQRMPDTACAVIRFGSPPTATDMGPRRPNRGPPSEDMGVRRFIGSTCSKPAVSDVGSSDLRLHSTSRLTTIARSSLPSIPASTLRAVEIAMRIAASLLRPAHEEPVQGQKQTVEREP
jgi:hypothetical protein